MSTIERPTESARLFDGQRLDRATFHALYERCEGPGRFELIGGVVYLVPYVGLEHGGHAIDAGYWLRHYAGFTPGTRAVDNASVLLDDLGEPQPDVLLFIRPENGGQARIEGKRLAGAPELAVEVSDSSIATDLGPKRADYQRAGVVEYVVMAVERRQILWHQRREGRLVRIEPDADGLYRSKAFPGLWLDPASLLESNDRRIREVIEQGVATPEHAAFVDRLALAKGVD